MKYAEPKQPEIRGIVTVRETPKKDVYTSVRVIPSFYFTLGDDPESLADKIAEALDGEDWERFVSHVELLNAAKGDMKNPGPAGARGGDSKRI